MRSLVALSIIFCGLFGVKFMSYSLVGFLIIIFLVYILVINVIAFKSEQ